MIRRETSELGRPGQACAADHHAFGLTVNPPGQGVLRNVVCVYV